MPVEATNRVQFLKYDLIRSGRFNCNELALLNIICSFSDRCEMNQSYLARAINKSVPTVRRTINSLIQKGIIVRTYKVFKRCVLRIIPLKQQDALMTVSGIIKQSIKSANNIRKKLVKSSVRSPMSEVLRSPMSEPTRSKTEEIKHIKIDKIKDVFSINKKPADLNKLKNEALMKYAKYMSSLVQ